MDDKMEARLRDKVIVAGYEALPDVGEWLILNAKLTPEGSVAALGDLVQCLPASSTWRLPEADKPQIGNFGGNRLTRRHFAVSFVSAP